MRKLSEHVAARFSDDSVALLCPNEANHTLRGVKLYALNLPIRVVATSHPDWPDAKRFSDLTNAEIVQLYSSAFRQILQVVNEFKPDVIHVNHASYFTWIAQYINAIYGIKYLVTIHGTSLITAAEDKRWIPLTRSALKHATIINTVSGHTKKWFLKTFGKAGIAHKTKVITGGIDLQTYPKELPIKIINGKYHLGNKKIVIFVGKLSEHKGVNYLIKAAPNIKAEIFILGSGEGRKDLEKLAQDLGADNVHFLGYFGKEYLNELREFYRRASVFVFPSVVDEALGLVALEAMASYTPVVASRKGGIPLAVKNDVTGYLVRARSAKAIAERVNYILEHPEVEERLGKAARELVEDRFDWKKITDRFHDYYEQTVQLGIEHRKRRKLPINVEFETLEIKKKGLDYI
ncbi:glycosyltransferase family 4 protein [Candidatus Berkelbacteria bacterium]|nr:glycosyltransferase family 4 protein [Candidatus Berkelbacteria bacterium]